MAASPVKVLKNTALAVENSFPPGKPRVMVVVTVTTPSAGWSVKLVRAAPQGIVREDLLLDIVAVPPRKISAKVITRHNLRYDESPAKVEYKTATIRGGTPLVTVPVHHIV